MTTSGNIFPQRLTKIDDLLRPDHSYLADADNCYFLGEYTARKGFAFSATNGLILNFKKSPERKGRAEWKYKTRAIAEAAAAFGSALNAAWLDEATLVPIPPSKAKNDPLYDDRMVRMLEQIRKNPALDIRELIVQKASMEAVHGSDDRPGPAELAANYTIDTALLQPKPNAIGLFDDLLTTGAHFCACKMLIEAALPDVPIIGLFIARRVPDAMDIEDLV